MIHDLLEWQARFPSLQPQFGGDIIVQGQGCAHIMMLIECHQDVKDAFSLICSAGHSGGLVAVTGSMGPVPRTARQ